MNGSNGGNGVVVLGSLNMDLIVRTEHLPAPGETILGGRFNTSPGGKGANQAVAAARLGARVSMVGAVGDDDYGRQLLRGAQADGVDVGHVRIMGEPTGVALIVVDARGQNLIAVAPGANGEVGVSIVEGAKGLLQGADVVVAQLETPLEAIVAMAGFARDVGVPFVLNAAPARRDLDELLRLVTVLVVNESELAAILGREVAKGREAAAASELLSLGPTAVVVTLGARGAVLVSAGAPVDIPSFPVEAVDCVGAGDAFVGALAARYAGLEALDESLRFAAAAGALACTKQGAQPSLPRLADVAGFMNRGRA